MYKCISKKLDIVGKVLLYFYTPIEKSKVAHILYSLHWKLSVSGLFCFSFDDYGLYTYSEIFYYLKVSIFQLWS